MGNQTGGNHDDCRISGCDCSDRLGCVGRAGAVDAGKLSDDLAIGLGLSLIATDNTDDLQIALM
jgi:hypothetical protein